MCCDFCQLSAGLFCSASLGPGLCCCGWGGCSGEAVDCRWPADLSALSRPCSADLAACLRLTCMPSFTCCLRGSRCSLLRMHFDQFGLAELSTVQIVVLFAWKGQCPQKALRSDRGCRAVNCANSGSVCMERPMPSESTMIRSRLQSCQLCKQWFCLHGRPMHAHSC